MYELIDKIIETNKLDTSEVLDLCYAICMSDMLHGSNRLELNVSKFLGTTGADSGWSGLLHKLGANPIGRDSLPKVQRFRVVTDALIIACCKRDKDLAHEEIIALTSEASGVVARACGLNPVSHEYCSIHEIEPILEALCVTSQDLDCVHQLENTLAQYEERFQGSGFSFASLVKDAWSKIKLPGKYRYIANGKCSITDVDELLTYLQDMIMYQIESEILRCIQLETPGNILKTVYMLNRFMHENSGVVFGTCSFSGNVGVLDVQITFKRQLRDKLVVLFSNGMRYDIQDLDKAVLLLRMMYMTKEYM